MSELKTSLIINLAGNLQAKAQQFNGAFTKLGASGSRSMNILSRSVSTVSKGLDRLGNRYTALLTGAAGVGSIKMVMGLEERFTYLGIQANKSAEEIDKLKKKIYEASMAPDVRINPSELTSAIEEIIEKTGDLQFAEDNLRNMALLIRATGAEGASIGEMFAEEQKRGIKDADEVLKRLDKMNVQGKEGAFTIKDLAAFGPQLYAAFGTLGRDVDGELGAIAQTTRMAVGSSEQATTAVQALIRTLNDADKVKILKGKKFKIQLYDPKELANGNKVLRPLNDIITELIKKTRGDMTLLSEVFDAEAIKALNAAINEFKNTGAITLYEKFLNMQGDGTTTLNDSARAAKTANAAMTQLYTAWKKFADEKLTEPIAKMADALNKLDPDELEKGLKIAGYGAAALGTAVVAKKGYNAYRWIQGILSKGNRGGASGTLGSLAYSMSNPMPVYVVNKYQSMLPDNYTSGAAGGAAGGVAGGMTKTRSLSFLKKAGMATGYGAAGYAIGTAHNLYENALLKITSRGKYDSYGAMLYDILHGEEWKERKFNRQQKETLEKHQKAEVTLKVETDQGIKARVIRMKSDNMDLNVDSGLMTVGTGF